MLGIADRFQLLKKYLPFFNMDTFRFTLPPEMPPFPPTKINLYSIWIWGVEWGVVCSSLFIYVSPNEYWTELITTTINFMIRTHLVASLLHSIWSLVKLFLEKFLMSHSF